MAMGSMKRPPPVCNDDWPSYCNVQLAGMDPGRHIRLELCVHHRVGQLLARSDGEVSKLETVLRQFLCAPSPCGVKTSASAGAARLAVRAQLIRHISNVLSSFFISFPSRR